MKEILIIGSLPPKIHGESLAIKSIIRSSDLQKYFRITTVNTNGANVVHAGKF